MFRVVLKFGVCDERFCSVRFAKWLCVDAFVHIFLFSLPGPQGLLTSSYKVKLYLNMHLYISHICSAFNI